MQGNTTMEVFRREIGQRRCDCIISETRLEYKIRNEEGRRIIIPKTVVRKMISKDTGFTSEKEVVDAIIVTVYDPYSLKLDYKVEVLQYRVWFEKICRGDKRCKYTSKLVVDVVPDLDKVVFMSVKNRSSFVVDERNESLLIAYDGESTTPLQKLAAKEKKRRMKRRRMKRQC